MSALRDRILASSLDELVEAAECGEIDPDEVWDEVLASLDRSTELLREMNQSLSSADPGWDIREIERRQDRIDAMIEGWRSELHAAGLLPEVDTAWSESVQKASGGV
jgi:hypothetical protein